MSRPRVVLATRNAHKVEELRRILGATGLDVEMVGLDEVERGSPVPEVAETGATFAENALLKAHAVARASGLPAVADDSGIAVDALNGMPGVLSARWAGRHGDDGANLQLVLDQLGDVPDERRGAAFVCAAAVALPAGGEDVVEGRLPGWVARAPRGSGGFGYDPVFVPQGLSVTAAELDPADKDRISHRGRAFRALVPRLAALLGVEVPAGSS